MNELIYNAIRTPDGTLLESLNRHDYKTHVDANGETYMVDGGLDYLRRSVNIVPATELSVYYGEDHAKAREVISWGTYGKDGLQPYRRIKLKDMEADHIEACIQTQHMSPIYRKAFEVELKFRKEV